MMPSPRKWFTAEKYTHSSRLWQSGFLHAEGEGRRAVVGVNLLVAARQFWYVA
jgi:hypothetical protein